MDTYAIYKDANGNAVTVKQGWSWPAFFFGFAWAFGKGMPGAALALIGAQVIAGLLIGAIAGPKIPAFLMLMISIAYSSLCGAAGNGWREKHLKSNGFTVALSTEAASSEADLPPNESAAA